MIMKELSILHNVQNCGRNSYGLGQISVNLAKAQYKLGHNTHIWSLGSLEDIAWAANNHDFQIERFSNFELFGPKKLYFSPHLIKSAKQSSTYGLFDIVHQHGLWTGSSSATRIFSKSNKVPTIIAPHGALSEWSLNLSRFKKKIALNLYERENLHLASCLHATAENEISDFRNFGLKNPIAYIENGIPDEMLQVRGDASRFRAKFQIDSQKRILLYLSRITPMKGLLMLVEAIKAIEPDFQDWQLVIVGNDEFNYKIEVEKQLVQYNLNDKVRFIEPLFDTDKDDVFVAAELFILPSYSEGFPMVVLDSLAAGVPVITTKATSWNDLTHHNCGWWIDINAQAVANSLQEAVRMSSDELSAMGVNAKNLIAMKYSWSKLGQKMILLYNWLLGGGNKPDFVQID